MIRVFILALLSVLPVTAMRSAEPDLSDPAVAIETWVRLKRDTACHQHEFGFAGCDTLHRQHNNGQRPAKPGHIAHGEIVT